MDITVEALVAEALAQWAKGNGCATSQWLEAASWVAVGSGAREIAEGADKASKELRRGLVCWDCVSALQDIRTVAQEAQAHETE